MTDARRRIRDISHGGECLEIQALAACGALPDVPAYATNNGHMFYLVTSDAHERAALINDLRGRGILAAFHYLALHRSPFFTGRHDGRALPHADSYSERLVRLPLYCELDSQREQRVIDAILEFYDRSAAFMRAMPGR
jgi:dTDP-4-amino-4,6-dideoxygalactose transaminase